MLWVQWLDQWFDRGDGEPVYTIYVWRLKGSAINTVVRFAIARLHQLGLDLFDCVW